MGQARLVPELDVDDLGASLTFYVDGCGFSVQHRRVEEAFAHLELDGAELMLQEAAGPGRRFRTAPLERPYGRGVNFQLQVADVRTVLARVTELGADVVVGLEERWYETGDGSVGNRQFVVADPDGYLVRCFEDIAAG